MAKDGKNYLTTAVSQGRGIDVFVRRLGNVLACVFFLGVAYFLLSTTVHYGVLRLSGATATGRVVDYKEVKVMTGGSGGRIGLYYRGYIYPVSTMVDYPIAAFNDANGKEHRFFVSKAGLSKGDAIDVVYDSANADDAMVRDDTAAGLKAFAGVATLVIAFLVAILTGKPKAKALK